MVLQQSDANLILYDTRTGGEVWKTQAIRSPGLGPFKMKMQGDGNLVISDRNNGVIWASNTSRNGDGPFRFTVQGDGNLVIYNRYGYTNADPAHKIWTR